jgi:hypothetical protein
VKDARYVDYARANASLGINGVSLNNVSSQPEMLLPRYLYFYMQTAEYWAHVDLHKGDRLKGGVNICQRVGCFGVAVGQHVMILGGLNAVTCGLGMTAGDRSGYSGTLAYKNFLIYLTLVFPTIHF